MKILIHLISGQSLPTYIASELIKPEKNIYLFTESLKKTLINYHKVIRTDYEEVLIDAYYYNKVFNAVSEIIKKFISEELVINFTGGTKLMSIAAFQAAQNFSKKAIYIDSDNSRVLSFLGTEITISEIHVEISPNDYLNLQGQNIKPPVYTATLEYEKLLLETADFIIKNKKLVYPFIMKFASKYTHIGRYLNHPASENSIFRGSYIKQENGLAEFLFCHKNKVLFNRKVANPEYLEYLRGKWFETACFIKIKNLSVFDKVESNLEINWREHYNYLRFGKNEIDIFGMHGIIPFVFECKSGRIEIAAVNKLKAIKETFLGRFSNIFFISLTEPSRDLYERFEENGITYINYNDLHKLKYIADSKKLVHY